jgi:hypothetical protein
MSKIKDIDKKIEKEIEKIKPEKELKIEKHEKPELKEKPEKRELKELKEPYKEKIEIKERKEFKEPFKEKAEIKEIKEFEKKVPEKGIKELGENVDPGDIFQGRTSDAESFGDPGLAAKPKEDEIKAAKEIEKIKREKEFPDKIQKEIEKIKPEKEFPDKLHKEIEKIKPEKEFPDKLHKEIEKIKPEKEFPDKLHKEIEKIKPEKEFPDKLHKELEKQFFENDPKGIVETPGTGPGSDPGRKGSMFSATGSPEDRLSELEDALTKLSHFIGVDLRPDLSSGALKDEPDAGAKPAAPPTDDKPKKPK